ncbi:two-component system sensor histidine kinase UhpB [Arcanobacterium wilhelmae]|uniref:histidine kinase n=1 Tax=Arcanobacterium wilhelmae TaxID=1803177 RepID=A0ABT9NAU3_9ACTO|nr:hypothetical protein [Arcanobacterium wilhelmae]MDP9800839.1 two-component system sensor histidine kinase UhpB [Arcanobacterium wilhelmae]WFN90213.1 hypothetical protein P8A24_08515 [Arcanobacterium wilhelmae]
MLLLILAGFYGIIFEYIFLLSAAVAIPLSPGGLLPTYVFGTYAIVVRWIDTDFKVRAIATLLIAQVGFTYFDPDPNTLARVVFFVLPIIFCITLGFFLRGQHHMIHSLEAENKEIEARTKADLASLLHDTTAKDIAHITVIAGDLLRSNTLSSAARDALEDIATIAGRSSRNLRPMILDLSSTTANKPLDVVPTETTRMLATRSITLTWNCADAEGEALSTPMRTLLPINIERLLSLAAREGATNILKYAPEGSTATATIAVGNGNASLTLTNAVAEQPVPTPDLTGGYGLENLAVRVERHHGTLDYGQIRDEWIFNLEVPIG